MKKVYCLFYIFVFIQNKMEKDDLLLVVVKSALSIEKELSNTIYKLFRIANPHSKMLFKPSSFSARNKVDLLKDLNLINTTDYNNIILQLEIRNIFIHNQDIISFEDCFEYLYYTRKSHSNRNSFKKIDGNNSLEKYINLTSQNLLNIKNILKSEISRVCTIIKSLATQTKLNYDKQMLIINISNQLQKIEKLNDIEEIKKQIRKIDRQSILKSTLIMEKEKKIDSSFLTTNFINAFIKNDEK